jgi:P4 family phage/plasmid primase-like protien
MTELNKNANPHKIAKYRQTIQTFLNNNRVGPGSKYSHISMGEYMGKFLLDTDKYEEFIEKYSEAIDYGVEFSIAEKLKDYGPLLIDIDLEIPNDDYVEGTRLYNDEMIIEIINCYRKVMNKYLDLVKNELEVHIFEKPQPTIKATSIKDGVHIIFPNVCAHYKLRHLIRHTVVETLAKEQGDLFSSFTKPLKDIIDKAVVSTNSWLLVGSKKPDGHMYNLTKIYDYENEIETKKIEKLLNNKKKAILKYSLQSESFNEDDATTLHGHLEFEDIEEEYAKKIGERNNNNNNVFNEVHVSEHKEDEIRRASYLVSLLSPERCDKYDDWIKIGWSLHNIDYSLLSIWITFSKQSKKFKEGDCDERWHRMRDDGYTIRSLMAWAEEDNYQKYHQFITQEFTNVLNKSLDGTTYSIAKALYVKYIDRFVCASMKNEAWYEFRGHKWEYVYDAYTLRREISETFVNEYCKLVSKYSLQTVDQQGSDKEQTQARVSKTNKIVEKLMDISFKDKVMKECKNLFFDPDFQEKLDENYDLVGFNNGVYDLENEDFRNGRPDDFISKSTNIDYHPFNRKNPYAEKMFKFFKDILPNDDVRNYFLVSLSICLSGHNKEEKLNIATGSGSNGKSLLFNLVQLALGDYYISCPITIITRKRGSSNQASPELLRIKGARCGCFQETDNDEKLNVGIMKEITGNDSFMVRGLFADPIEIKPQIKFFLACNQLPVVPSTDGGTWRRLRVVNFGSKFVESPEKANEFLIDNTLKIKIKEWAPIFASYLIELYVKEYKKCTYLVEPDAVKYSTNCYKMENDHFTEYFTLKIIFTNNKKDKLSSKGVYDDFKAWYKSSRDGVIKAPPQSELTKFLIDKIGEPKTDKWIGYTFKSEDDNSLDTHSDNESSSVKEVNLLDR